MPILDDPTRPAAPSAISLIGLGIVVHLTAIGVARTATMFLRDALLTISLSVEAYNYSLTVIDWAVFLTVVFILVNRYRHGRYAPVRLAAFWLGLFVFLQLIQFGYTFSMEYLFSDNHFAAEAGMRLRGVSLIYDQVSNLVCMTLCYFIIWWRLIRPYASKSMTN